MKIIKMRTENLIPYENNPRINDGAVDAVAASIQEFGFKNPIIIDRDGVIISGHTRLKAAYKLGLETVPCIRADDLDDEQVRALRLTDNKTSELSGWDYSLLSGELQSVIDIDMTEFGFTQDEISIPDINIDMLFESAETKEKEPKKVTCPYCGETFEA